MATKSFYTEFKLNSKSGNKLVNAFENSQEVKHTITQSAKDVTNDKEVKNILDSFLGKG